MNDLTRLEPIVRGDTFRYSFVLSASGANFTGGVAFTLRRKFPRTSDTDSGAVHRSTVANGELWFEGTLGKLEIPASITTTWDPRVYVWDLQGVVAGEVPVVHTLDRGELEVLADVSRGTGA